MKTPLSFQSVLTRSHDTDVENCQNISCEVACGLRAYAKLEKTDSFTTHMSKKR